MRSIDDQLDVKKIEAICTDEEWALLVKEKVAGELLTQTVDAKWFKKIQSKYGHLEIDHKAHQTKKLITDPPSKKPEEEKKEEGGESESTADSETKKPPAETYLDYCAELLESLEKTNY